MSIENEDDIIVNGDDEAVEIETDDGSVDSSDDEAEIVAERKRKRGNTAEKRIKALSAGKSDAERRAASAEQFARAEAERARVMENLTTDFAAESIVARREIAKMKLKDAKLRDDIDAETQHLSELSELDAKYSQIERYRNNPSKVAEPATPTKEQGGDLDSYYEKGTPATRNFIDDNRDWLDSRSSEYDQEKAQDVITYAGKLEKELRSTGRGSEVGTKAYYTMMNKYIRDNWDDDDEEVVQDTPKKVFGASATGTPVGSRGVTPAKKGNAVNMKLSAEERDVAVSMVLKHPNGRDMTDDEKLKRYAIRKSQIKQ